MRYIEDSYLVDLAELFNFTLKARQCLSSQFQYIIPNVKKPKFSMNYIVTSLLR